MNKWKDIKDPNVKDGKDQNFTTFVVCNYRDTKDRFIIADIEDTITLLEDHSMSIQTMMGSKHVTEIRPLVEEWEKKLGYYSDCIDEWLTFQR